MSFKTQLAFSATAWIGCMVAPLTADASVDIFLAPASQILETGRIVEIELRVQSDGTASQAFTAIDAILEWDPSYLRFLNADISPAGYAWFISGFLPNADGMNESFEDGSAMFTAQAAPGAPAAAPASPASMLIAVFRFETLAAPANTDVALPHVFGSFSRTRVLGATAGSDVTGAIGPPVAIIIVGPCSPTVGDVDGDNSYTMADITAAVDVYLGIQTNPAAIVAADANCDGIADGADIQPLVEFLLLVL